MYIFDLSKLEIYEIGAALATIMAFPKGDEEKHNHFHIALCSEALRTKCERDQEWANNPQRIKPLYAFHDLGAVQMDLNTINRQLQYRLHAAHVAHAFLKEAEMGQTPPDLPEDAKRLSINEMVRTLDFGEEIDVDNFETRIWRPSLSVIHLAAAFALNGQIAYKNGKETSLGDLIFDKDMITFIVQEAEKYEQLLPKTKIRINMEKLIKVRLIDS